MEIRYNGLVDGMHALLGQRWPSFMDLYPVEMPSFRSSSCTSNIVFQSLLFTRTQSIGVWKVAYKRELKTTHTVTLKVAYIKDNKNYLLSRVDWDKMLKSEAMLISSDRNTLAKPNLPAPALNIPRPIHHPVRRYSAVKQPAVVVEVPIESSVHPAKCAWT